MTGPDRLRDLSPPIAAPLGTVTTARLTLSPFTPNDVGAVMPIFARREVWHYPYRRGLTHEESAAFVAGQVQHWSECGFGLWLASERSDKPDGGRAVGYVGLSVPTFLPEILPAVEVGWRLDPSVWGRGYATEGATAALDRAFSVLGVTEVHSVTEPANAASNRVEERLGLRLQRTLVLPGTDARGPIDAWLWRITAREWAARRAGPA